MNNYYILIFAVLLVGSACKNDKITQSQNDFAGFAIKKAGDTGLDFSNTLDKDPALNIVEYLYYYNGAGVAVGDINGDGLDDIYMAANQGMDKLFLNKGGLKFEDISEKAGLEKAETWSNGVTMDDVNGDGLIDIYVCKMALLSKEVHNLLYINQGNGTFLEKSVEYGLDFRGLSTQSCFLDYDQDGDLDMYLLNHAIHSVHSYGSTKKRAENDPISGDRFYENRLNEGGKFVEVSKIAGILSSPLGYGLAVTAGDLNNDGWTDIYVGNDFHENDYIYFNNGDKTFTESVKSAVSHTTEFSMGVDFADMNNDGWLDIFSTDMYPFQSEVLLRSAGEDTDEVKRIKDDLGFELQYARNHFQINQQNGSFAEVGYMEGVFASDWSWSVLLQDFDNDSRNDIFISNGIVHRPNDLDYIRYLDKVDSLAKTPSERSRFLIENMPSQPLQNLLFLQKNKGSFTDLKAASFGPTTFSTAAAFADFDQDGDLDIIVNNVNSDAFLMENETNTSNSHLNIRLEAGKGKTSKGAKLIAQTGDDFQYKEVQTTRGFMASSTAEVHFGLGQSTKIDELKIIWPDGKMQSQSNVPVNQKLTIKRAPDAELQPYAGLAKTNSSRISALPYEHEENKFYDENTEKLIPERLAYDGPALLVEDLTGDGIPDMFIGGARGFQAHLLIGKADGSFEHVKNAEFERDAQYEDICAASIDFDKDGDRDLYVVSGGGDNQELDKLLEDRLYLNNGKGVFKRVPLSLPHTNGSVVAIADYDKDGYEDLFIGARSIPGSYGLSPYSFVLKNKGGKGLEIGSKERFGMVTDAVWADIDGDNDQDLVLCGDWMNITVYENEGGKLTDKTAVLGLDSIFGFWNTIELVDLNQDGKLDILAGNSGTNQKWTASQSQPIQLYVGDYDGNGSADPLIFYSFFGTHIPFASLDKLSAQMPMFKKKFTTYESYTKVHGIKDLIENYAEKTVETKQVNELRSMVFLSKNSIYEAIPLGKQEQVSDIQDFELGTNGKVYYVGNNAQYVTELGANLSNSGRVLAAFDAQTGTFKSSKSLGLPVQLDSRAIQKIGSSYFIVVSNNDRPYLFLQE